MKICITSSGNTLESQIDPRFGRCRYFIIWDYSTNTFEVIDNPNIDAGSGAGIQSAQLVVGHKVSQVITGEVGPKAEKVLQTANVQIITNTSGSIKDVIEKYRNDTANNVDTVSHTDNNSDKVDTKKTDTSKNNIKSGFATSNKRKGCGMGNGMGGRANRGFGHIAENFCICPKCGEKQPHQRGVPCRSIKCVKCGSSMIRE